MDWRTYKGKLKIDPDIKEVPSAYGMLFERSRALSSDWAARKASDVFNDMVRCYYINELGYSEEDFQYDLDDAVDAGMSADGLTLDPDPKLYPETRDLIK